MRGVWLASATGLGVLLLIRAGTHAADQAGPPQKNELLQIQSVSVDGKTLAWNQDHRLKLSPFPKAILFSFGSALNSDHAPIRTRYKLDGFDSDWRETTSVMSVTVRFYDEAGDQLAQSIFEVTGDSAGWKGGLTESSLTHRREPIVVPPRATRLWIVITSAGPPNAVGIYVVDDLVVSRVSTNQSTEAILRLPFDGSVEHESLSRNPPSWIRDGTHPSLARIIDLGQNPVKKAFAILDDDPAGHAEWHNIMEYAPRVVPGDHLLVEWNEMFSIGMGNTRTATYASLPPGAFRFRVAAVTAMGTPTGVEASLAVLVPPPFWQEPWFWSAVFVVATVLVLAATRSVMRYRMRQELVLLEQQRALEQERSRIAHDIHDDLGARVTQISLLSAMAHDNSAFPEPARAAFDQISRMCRELVSALYETVWAANPENDNLDALGNYLCQMVNQLCEQAQLRCRLHVVDLPHELQISSQTRHNISLTVKEAMHNVIKHAQASEVTLRMALESVQLVVSLHDDGRGFQPGAKATGNGLANMRRRMEKIGGTCAIESQPASGATVILKLALKPADQFGFNHA